MAITVAAIQLPQPDVWDDSLDRKRANVDLVASRLAAISDAGVDLAILPEYWSIAGIHRSVEAITGMADVAEGELYQRLAELAATHRLNLVAPVLERTDNGFADAAWVFDRDGAFIGRSSKVHLRRDERELGIVPGNGWPVFALDCCRLGIMICLDAWYPESARCLALNGANLIAWPHMMSGWGESGFDAVTRTRAVENGIHLVSAAYGIVDRAWMPGDQIGKSGVIAPDGTILSSAGHSVTTAIARIDPEAPHLIAEFVESASVDGRSTILANRRPATYRSLID